MPALVHELLEYTILGMLVIIGVYLAARVGTWGVMQSINDWHRRYRDKQTLSDFRRRNTNKWENE